MVANEPRSLARRLAALTLLWFAGAALRFTVLAVPPVIARIKDDLALTATQVGLLTGLPVCAFAIAAIPGSLLIARLGALPALLGGLLLTTMGSALRALAGGAVSLEATTALMGFGIAVMQPALPPLVRSWVPRHVGLGTAIYANGLLVGEIAPVALAQPLLGAVEGSWRLALVAWSVPLVAIAALVALLGPRLAHEAKAPTAQRRWPNWKSGLVWRLGLVFGSITSIYFATNGFLPVYLRVSGQTDWTDSALTALNFGQMPASLLLLVFAHHLIRLTWPYVAAAAGALVGILALLASSGGAIVVASALVGFCCGAVLVLALALPPLLCAPQEVAPTSAAMFTVSYACAVLVPILSGAVWDATGIPASAFLPILACALVLLVLAPRFEKSSGHDGSAN
jgi:CP family cyanate transporter-like MFS transporter